MSPLYLLGIAVALAMDAFAVSIAAGLAVAPLTRRHVFRLSFHFGLFQFLMPVVGWAAGRSVADQVARYDHWVAFGLLGFLGGKMLLDAITDRRDKRASAGRFAADPTRGLMLVSLSVATSIDALAVGLSVAFMEVSIWAASVLIGLTAGAFTVVGIRFGNRIGHRWGRWAEVLGGAVLIAIGVRVLISHL